MGKKMIAIQGMDQIPVCKYCPFQDRGEYSLFCMAQSYFRPGHGRGCGWFFHKIALPEGLYDPETFRDPSCPLVVIECTPEAYWVQESDKVVLCSRCDSGFQEALIHDVADYGEREYPMYCPSCGAYMVNWETGEDPEAEA